MWTAIGIVSLISGGIGIFLKIRNRNRSKLSQQWTMAKWLIWIGETKERWRAWWYGESVSPAKPKKRYPLRPWLNEDE